MQTQEVRKSRPGAAGAADGKPAAAAAGRKRAAEGEAGEEGGAAAAGEGGEAAAQETAEAEVEVGQYDPGCVLNFDFGEEAQFEEVGRLRGGGGGRGGRGSRAGRFELRWHTRFALCVCLCLPDVEDAEY